METRKKWHDRNINYLKKFYEKDEYLQIDYSSNQTRCLIRCQIHVVYVRSLSRGVCHYDLMKGSIYQMTILTYENSGMNYTCIINLTLK